MRAGRLAAGTLALAALAAAAVADVPGKPRAVTEADYAPVDRAEAELGQLLFYDPILSGNREVACATCHHPAFGTSDGLSLGLGDGGRGLGPERMADPDNLPEERIPRNATGLFNLGAREFAVLFHDGRIEADPTRPTGLRTPMGAEMEQGFASVLAAQTMFPVLSGDEMAGHYSENDVSRAVRQGIITGPGGAWDLLSRRVAAIPAYAARFEAVYGLAPDEIGFADVSNAIAAFVAFEWRSDTAPFDAWLRGEAELAAAAADGAALFYGEAGCGGCHAGPFLTDHGFHAMGEVQIGPGKKGRFEDHARDVGRMRVTGDAADAYRFRTPSLRNVALTGPWGHAGAYGDLAAYIRHHADPPAGLDTYERAQAVLPALEEEDWRVLDDAAERAALAAAYAGTPVTLDADEVAALVAFLDSLTDPVARTGRLGVPDAVPSGLEVPRPR
ncbi:methylamine utilization protein MauG, putative [Oceanicola granulosus HTCC2516]|uniref:Methylamine utilization protein MauG, putative n=1 Tax=Oceanicola granulosus (strain ATCC BAA-861 / DSM 15982 / KCTC 12143 / HTCC2516) TaxID=314256 RepID=Q2C9Z7_OCEGH|nr:cytochrome-c peroxidase [Oceanicola granulosus]EAR49488.1 methylamine utilization protein MauG, putative [Oceanicola granulosus HTCC2516]